MFQNFPYTDMHQLNLDWIIKIAKDFLDQYTTIQQLIETGIENINTATTEGENTLSNKTTELIAELETKKTNIENLLNQWYNTHSQDIANQLADALNQIQTTLTAAINTFDQQADAKIQTALASIPDDYSEMAADVEMITDDIYHSITLMGNFYDIDGFYQNGVLSSPSYIWTRSKTYPVYGASAVHIERTSNQYYDVYTVLDAERNVLTHEYTTNAPVALVRDITLPDGATYLVLSGSEANLNNAVVSATFINDAIIDFRTLGKLLSWFWTYDNNFEKQWLALMTYETAVYDVADFDIVRVTTAPKQYAQGLVLLDRNFNITNRALCGDNLALYNAGSSTTFDLYVGDSTYIGLCYKRDDWAVPSVKGLGTLKQKTLSYQRSREYVKNNPWAGKRVVWFGTSIPAAGLSGFGNANSYPDRVGALMNLTMYNEAVGSSSVHCRDPRYISANNPYGFIPNFENVSRCITNSIAEMNYIIQHYNDPNIFTQNVPSSLSDADKEFIRSCSYENKLEKYFTASTIPDLFVLDHGHNDYPTAASEQAYSARTPLVGTQHDGFYTAGTFVTSTASSYIEYDVSNIDEVWISGTFGSYYDICDLLDANNNIIGYKQNGNTETPVYSYFVDTRNATKLYVSNLNTLLSTINVVKYTYGSMNDSLFSYQGGMDFLISKIKEYNPHATIIMIGEYENQKYPNIAEWQTVVSNRWEIPLYEQWKVLGWSQQLILANGTYKTMLNIMLPDNLHPHSDTSGKALNQMAENISAWLNTIRK